jgi:hypothetical protein
MANQPVTVEGAEEIIKIVISEDEGKTYPINQLPTLSIDETTEIWREDMPYIKYILSNLIDITKIKDNPDEINKLKRILENSKYMLTQAKTMPYFSNKSDEEIIQEINFDKYNFKDIDNFSEVIKNHLHMLLHMSIYKELPLSIAAALIEDESKSDWLYTFVGGFKDYFLKEGKITESVHHAEGLITNTALILFVLVTIYCIKKSDINVTEEHVKEIDDIIKSKYILLDIIQKSDKIDENKKLFLKSVLLEQTHSVSELNKIPDLENIKLIINIIENKLENINKNFENYRMLNKFKLTIIDDMKLDVEGVRGGAVETLEEKKKLGRSGVLAPTVAIAAIAGGIKGLASLGVISAGVALPVGVLGIGIYIIVSIIVTNKHDKYMEKKYNEKMEKLKVDIYDNIYQYQINIIKDIGEVEYIKILNYLLYGNVDKNNRDILLENKSTNKDKINEIHKLNSLFTPMEILSLVNQLNILEKTIISLSGGINCSIFTDDNDDTLKGQIYNGEEKQIHLIDDERIINTTLNSGDTYNTLIDKIKSQMSVDVVDIELTFNDDYMLDRRDVNYFEDGLRTYLDNISVRLIEENSPAVSTPSSGEEELEKDGEEELEKEGEEGVTVERPTIDGEGHGAAEEGSDGSILNRTDLDEFNLNKEILITVGEQGKGKQYSKKYGFISTKFLENIGLNDINLTVHKKNHKKYKCVDPTLIIYMLIEIYIYWLENKTNDGDPLIVNIREATTQIETEKQDEFINDKQHITYHGKDFGENTSGEKKSINELHELLTIVCNGLNNNKPHTDLKEDRANNDININGIKYHYNVWYKGVFITKNDGKYTPISNDELYEFIHESKFSSKNTNIFLKRIVKIFKSIETKDSQLSGLDTVHRFSDKYNLKKRVRIKLSNYIMIDLYRRGNFKLSIDKLGKIIKRIKGVSKLNPDTKSKIQGLYTKNTSMFELYNQHISNKLYKRLYVKYNFILRNYYLYIIKKHGNTWVRSGVPQEYRDIWNIINNNIQKDTMNEININRPAFRNLLLLEPQCIGVHDPSKPEDIKHLHGTCEKLNISDNKIPEYFMPLLVENKLSSDRFIKPEYLNIGDIVRVNNTSNIYNEGVLGIVYDIGNTENHLTIRVIDNNFTTNKKLLILPSDNNKIPVWTDINYTEGEEEVEKGKLSNGPGNSMFIWNGYNSIEGPVHIKNDYIQVYDIFTIDLIDISCEASLEYYTKYTELNEFIDLLNQFKLEIIEWKFNHKFIELKGHSKLTYDQRKAVVKPYNYIKLMNGKMFKPPEPLDVIFKNNDITRAVNSHIKGKLTKRKGKKSKDTKRKDKKRTVKRKAKRTVKRKNKSNKRKNKSKKKKSNKRNGKNKNSKRK